MTEATEKRDKNDTADGSAKTSAGARFYEVRFHGRGGQGAVSAAALLALAAFDAGFEAQAFPKYGSERRGAPVEAYVRISKTLIRTHNQIYTPDAVVVQDSTLLRSEPALQGLKHKGLIVLNSEHEPQQRVNLNSKFRWLCVPASRIAEKHLGRPLPNTVLLGALVAGTDWVDLAALEQAVEDHFVAKGEKMVTSNIEALREGYRIVSQLEETP